MRPPSVPKHKKPERGCEREPTLFGSAKIDGASGGEEGSIGVIQERFLQRRKKDFTFKMANDPFCVRTTGMHPERPVILPTDAPVYILCSVWALEEKVQLHGVFSWDDLLEEIHTAEIYVPEDLQRVLEDGQTQHFCADGFLGGSINYYIRRVPASPQNRNLIIAAVKNVALSAGNVTIVCGTDAAQFELDFQNCRATLDTVPPCVFVTIPLANC